MKVFVIGSNGIGLMPTTPRKARKLLEQGKAEVAQMNPFTIRLNYKTGSATQLLNLGVDTGEQHIGFAVTTDDGEVLSKHDVELRKSMEKRKLMETRKEYRRGRRYRKVRYRRSKFKFKRKRVYSETPDKKGRHWHTVKPDRVSFGRQEGWLPPSIQSKVDHHIFWIRKFQKALPLNTRTVIEVARFDVQRMQNPEIHGELYQQGRMHDYENEKAYILAKYNYTCPVCGHKFDGTHKPRMHHITYKSKGATDNPDEYAPVCEQCHTAENHLPGGVLDKLRKANKRKEYREPTFMSILRKRLFTAFPKAVFTYGNITAGDRKLLHIAKSHANDAVVVSLQGKDIKHVANLPDTVMIKQVRRKKRSLHEANPRKGRKEPNRTAWREPKNTDCVNGFHKFDTVLFNGQRGYISGFSKTAASAYVVDFDGNYITQPGKSYKTIPLSKLQWKQTRTNNYISEEVGDDIMCLQFLPPPTL